MSTKKQKMTFVAKVKKYKSLIPFVIPAMMFALVFSYLPMTGILIAFKDNPNFLRYDVLTAFQKSEWTLENFRILFSDPEILSYIRNTLIISVMKIVILFPMPIILAVMITELRSKKFSKLVQGIVFLPHFFSWIVIVGIFNSIFGMYGPINNLSVALGGEVVHFMGEPGWFRWLVVILSGWKEIGYSSIAYIAAIMSIDPALYEAAKIDGAGKLKQIWNITIPSIMPTIIVMLIIRIGYLMDAGFEQVYAMLNSLTRETGEIIGTYVYRLGFSMGKSDYGLSTAVGLFNGVISLILILTANYFSKKKTGNGVW
ncbi:MAG: sugar ABC transporter permease [Clostridia bacterium]|nr:sugar ABC transporter permease [Clostridia bacterium]